MKINPFASFESILNLEFRPNCRRTRAAVVPPQAEDANGRVAMMPQLGEAEAGGKPRPTTRARARPARRKGPKTLFTIEELKRLLQACTLDS